MGLLIVSELISLERALHVILVNVLDALQFILFISLSDTFTFLHFIACKVLEKLDKGIIRHVISSIYEALSLSFYIVFLVLLIVFVESLVLHRRTVGVRVQVVHIGEAHVAEVGFVIVVADVDGHTVAVVFRVILRELRHFELGGLTLFVAEDRASDGDVVLIAVVVDIVQRLVVLSELGSEEFFDRFNCLDFDVTLCIFSFFITALVTHQRATDWDGYAQIL